MKVGLHGLAILFTVHVFQCDRARIRFREMWFESIQFFNHFISSTAVTKSFSHTSLLCQRVLL